MKHLVNATGLAVVGCALTIAAAGAPACADSASERTRSVSREMFRMYASGGAAPHSVKDVGRPRGKQITKHGGSYYNAGRAINSGNFSTVIRSRGSNNSSNSYNTANGGQHIVIHHRR